MLMDPETHAGLYGSGESIRKSPYIYGSDN